MSSKGPGAELDETKGWRDWLADYLGMVRALVDQVFGVVTGGDGVGKEHWREVLHRVGDAVDSETAWLRHLVDASIIIGRYILQLQRWRSHINDVCTNLHLSKEELRAVLFWSVDVRRLFEKQKYTIEYLHWAASTALSDLVQLVDESEEVASKAPALLQSSQSLPDRFLKSAANVAQRLSPEFRKAVYDGLHQCLVTAYNSQNVQEAKSSLADYLEIFARLLKTSRLMVDDRSDQVPLSAEELDRQSDRWANFPKWEGISNELVDLRSKAYYHFIEHELALMRSLFPERTDFGPFLVEFHTDLTRSVPAFLPSHIEVELLALGVTQALEHLEELNRVLARAEKLLQKVSRIPVLSYVGSPELEKFQTAEIARMRLFQGQSGALIGHLQKLHYRLVSETDVTVDKPQTD